MSGDPRRPPPFWLIAVFIAVMVLWYLSLRQLDEPKGDLVQWVSADRAERVAAETRKPLLYEFSAAWCGPCRMMEAEVFRDATLAALINEKFVPVRLIDRKREEGRNQPEVARLQSAYDVRAFPTIVVVRAGGEPRAVRGYPGKWRFEEFLRGNH